MNIKLNWLRLSNFKGIKDFKLDAQGKNVSVFGNNGTGKTTLQDAWTWLLFDKDSNNNADTKFTIKPQDKFGQDINHLQTVVEAELLVDGKPLMLKKLREENWVTRRGTTEPVMDGHVKKYWFNEVPVKAKEYQSKVGELVNENIFKMITDPLYFNTKLSWQDRRQMLLKISGDKTVEEVIASDESLSKLTEILNGRTIPEYELVLADRLKELKKDRDNIPPRIDELTRSLPQEEPDYTAIESEINKYKQDLSSIEWLLVSARDKADEISKKYQKLAKMNNQLEEIKAKIKANSGADRTNLIEKKAELENGKILLESGIRNLEQLISMAKNTLENNAAKRAELLNKWHDLNVNKAEIQSETFELNIDNENCPTCGQELPKEMIEQKIKEMEENFYKNKESNLRAIELAINENVAEGKALKENTEETQRDLELAEEELSQKETALKKLEQQVAKLDYELSKPIAEPDYTKYPEYNELLQKIQELQSELDKPIEDKSSELLQRKADIQVKIDELNKVLNGKEELEKKKARITSLKVEEKRLSSQIAELEGHKFLLERFIVAKVNLLEDSINSQFKHVRFKLFEENVTNDGIKETCVALVNTNGSYVKYEDANSAGKINAGIDIINSLTKFYEVQAPIFVDNAESVTDLADTDAQVIRLIKPEIRDEEDRKKYSQLVVEVEE